MNIIDTLVVLLKLDSKDFKRGQAESRDELKKTKESVTKDTKHIEAHARALSEGFRRVRNELLAIGTAVATAALGGRYIQNLNAADIATGRLAKTLGATTDEISAWAGMAHRAGGTAEGMAATISNIANLITKLRATGNSELLPFLSQAHVDKRFLNESTTWTERLMMIADAFQHLDPQVRKFLGGQIGMDEGAIRLLGNSRSALEAMLREQRAVNVVTGEQAEVAEQAERAYRELEQRFDSMVRVLKTQYLPVLIDAGNQFARWLDLNKEFIATNIADGIHEAAKALQTFWRDAQAVLEKLAQWNKDPKSIIGDASASIFKPEVHEWLKKQKYGEGVVGRMVDWFWNIKPENKPPSPSAFSAFRGAPASDTDSHRFGTAAFAEMLHRDMRAGAVFQGGAFDRLTRGASAAASLAKHAAAAGAPGASTTQVHVGKIADSIVVQTQATDARGVASDLGPLLRNHLLASQGASGMR